jgi:predicted dehydrogenase
MPSLSLPDPTNEPLRGGPTLRWGVIGPGGIAHAWVDAVRTHTDQPVVAVASRSRDRAEAFAAAHGVERSFGSYEELLADPGVDAVYIATPHSEHRRLGVLAASAGKHVLVEKPIGVSAEDARAIKAAAAEHGVLAAEALWTNYLPGFSVVTQAIARGDIGDVRLASVDVGWAVPRELAPRLYDPELGGGALLDMGVYAFWFAQYAIGRPTAIQATGSFVDTGVDGQIAAVLDADGQRMATVTTSMTAHSTGLASIMGTAGSIRFVEPFVFPASFVLQAGGEEVRWEPSGPLMREGLAYPAPAIARAVADGLTDSPVYPIDRTIEVMETLDAVRDRIAPLRGGIGGAA